MEYKGMELTVSPFEFLRNSVISLLVQLLRTLLLQAVLVAIVEPQQDCKECCTGLGNKNRNLCGIKAILMLASISFSFRRHYQVNILWCVLSLESLRANDISDWKSTRNQRRGDWPLRVSGNVWSGPVKDNDQYRDDLPKKNRVRHASSYCRSFPAPHISYRNQNQRHTELTK